MAYLRVIWPHLAGDLVGFLLGGHGPEVLRVVCHLPSPSPSPSPIHRTGGASYLLAGPATGCKISESAR